MAISAFDLVKQDMQRAVDLYRAEIDTRMFYSIAGIPTAPPTRREIWRRRLAAVRNYCSVLSQALRGRDLVERSEDW